MDSGKILFTLTYVKHKQFDRSLQVNRKSIKTTTTTTTTVSRNIKTMISEF